MNLTKQQVEAAINAGLAVTDPTSETLIAMKHAPGLLILRGLLQAIGSGAIALQSVPGMSEKVETPPEIPPEIPPEKNGRKARKVKPPAKVRRKKK